MDSILLKCLLLFLRFIFLRISKPRISRLSRLLDNTSNIYQFLRIILKNRHGYLGIMSIAKHLNMESILCGFILSGIEHFKQRPKWAISVALNFRRKILPTLKSVARNQRVISKIHIIYGDNIPFDNNPHMYM